MTRILRTLHDGVQHLFLALAGLSLGVVFAVVLTNSISRYLFHSSFVWGGSVSTYGMIYGTAFGVLAAYTQGLNVRFNIVTEFLSPRVNAVLELVSHLLTIAVGIAFTISAFEFVHSRGRIVITGLNLTTAYMQSAMIVLGAGLIVVASAKAIICVGELPSRLRGPAPEAGEP